MEIALMVNACVTRVGKVRIVSTAQGKFGEFDLVKKSFYYVSFFFSFLKEYF